MEEVHRQDVEEMIARGAQVAEVLPSEEFDEDHLPGAINLHLRSLETDAPKMLDKSRPVVVYCWDSA